MVTDITVVPAHGRDYATAAEALAAWGEGKDFIIMTPGIGGTYINKEDAARYAPPGTEVRIRYNKRADRVDVDAHTGDVVNTDPDA